ncbi:MAG: type II secretion system F family protein [Bacteroidetes bacterium]|nr:type II secretion system F family protein [Bacteroidota bacterium]HET6243887.1 type II secretion system F family protein [Bacteroidia bacterium]
MATINLSKYPLNKKNNVEKKKIDETSIFDFLNKDISIFGSQLNDKKKERFYSELNILFTAGVDIKTTLELIEEEQVKKVEKELYRKIRESVINGVSLSEAIKLTGKFSTYEYYSIMIGEESGRLTTVLDELAVFFSKKIKQKRLVLNALSYPTIVLLVAFGAIFFMLKFIVPMFADVFLRFGGDLPYITKLIIKISKAFSLYAWYFIFCVLGISIFFFLQKQKDWFRRLSADFIMKTPIFGNIIQKIYLARFCHSMNLLISAKTPLLQAIQLVKKMVGFYPIEYSLGIVESNVLKGEPLSLSLSRYPVYNKRLIALIKVAEEVNQLDLVFGKLAKQYTDEVEHQTSLIGSLIEPIMIIFLGLLVTIILVAMYLPLFQLSTSFG